MHVRVYADRIEVVNPGLVAGRRIDVDEFLGLSGGEGQAVAGHLHRAVVSHWFVRAFVTPVD
ncbi:hypothetical protein [Dactylosporangium sp. NPDC006015]|uniref:hypothetical protein n=1 Tax=Dactylosporangium sp. NPDC006015 TaxID=3154576 RepID=UPI0033A716C4